jgi:peroxiredoxin
MLELGTEAPAFSLPDVVSGKTISLGTFDRGAPLLVMFICRHCPYVKHVQDELARLGAEYQRRGVGVVAISSNDASSHPEDAPDSLKAMAQDLGYTFPVCYDESQAVAKAYAAACTPDFFVFDQSRRLAYRGQFDDSRPKSATPVTGSDLRAALDAVLARTAAPAVQKPSMGCNIKWKRGNEPQYFTA